MQCPQTSWQHGFSVVKFTDNNFHDNSRDITCDSDSVGSVSLIKSWQSMYNLRNVILAVCKESTVCIRLGSRKTVELGL